MKGNLFRIGERIKELRVERRLSLRSLARLSGLSVNALSKIEKDLSSPSVSTLYKIAEALDVPMIYFFQERAQNKFIVFCKKDQGVKLPFLRGVWEGFGTEPFAGGIEPFLLTLEAGGGSGRFHMVHSADEFVYCLEGAIEYEVERERYLLEPGDCLMFLAHRKHRWRNAAKERSRALVVLFDLPHSLRRREIQFVESA
ncbi:MAG: XRE family transcriptional regulator [Anaerolineales bacterium]|nr:XRE family transcriptional regulator [Anaerolineales bacterium]MDW8446547.1 XRE family transcriptional regulator [Anaerolineales bacterium]